MTIPAGSNYLVQSQAAREAVCIAWAVAFMAYFGLYGKYQGDMDGKVGKTAHLGTRLMGIGIFLIVFMFLLIGNPLSVLLYNGGKVSNSASLAISGRLLFIASIAVYVYSAATGLFMFVFWAK
ncbi:hypothetical protein H4R19_002529 [Coemansia spiralis]|nr:hypothetical protein H4R19_002529 [Coemansia spiralis]